METGLSPQLRRILVQPRNETDYQATKRLLTETLNLTRAAVIKGLVQDDESILHFDLEDNSLYSTYTRADQLTLVKLLCGLNIDTWGQEDVVVDSITGEKVEKADTLEAEDSFILLEWKDKRTNNRRGVLVDNTSLEKELDDPWRREKIMGKAGGDDSDVIFKLKVVDYSPLKSIEYKKFPYHESQLTTPSNGKETRSVTGVNTSLKRKKLSPYGEVQVARALK